MNKIYLIAAISKNNVIGKNGELPWHYSKDLMFFKKTTLNSIVIMGRKTFESIGRPLPNRHNIVVSKTLANLDNVQIEPSLTSAIDSINKDNQKPIFIIGGEGMYKEALMLNIVSKMYLTFIDKEFDGDVCFPEYEPEDWDTKQVVEEIESNTVLRFCILEKIG